MINLTWFESVRDLKQLTGLDRNELWDAGFDLDDLDFGVMTNQKLDKQVEDIGDYECGYFYLIKALSATYAMREVEYNGKYYYMRYHA